MSGRSIARLILPLLAAAGIGCGGAREAPPEEHHEAVLAGEVHLTEAAARAAGIEVVPLAPASFHPHVVASGVIRPVTGKSVTLRAPAAGRVASVAVDVGDRVAAGRPLATLEGPELTEAIARYRVAVARHDASRRAAERAERLLAQEAISRAESEARRAESEAAAAEAEAARQELVRLGLDPGAGPTATARFPIVTPIGGTILARHATPGLLVARDAPLFEVADLQTVWAVVDIYEKDLGQVTEQGEAEITTEAYPGRTFTGRIALIEPMLEEASRTAHVRVVLDNADCRFRPGLFVSVALPIRASTDAEATAVPAGAVQMVSGLPAVFVEIEPGRFRIVPVETGREAHGMIEIRRGLEPGARVVTAGAFVLKSELLKATIGGDEH